MKIRAITIDFWGTLLTDGPGADDVYRRRRMLDFRQILAAAGISVTAAELERAYDASGAFLARVWSLARDVPVEGHVQALLDSVDAGLRAQLPRDVHRALIEAYVRPAMLVPPAVDSGALSALETLSDRGYTLAVVSNTMRTPGSALRTLLDRFRLLSYFKHTTFSDEVGIRKPDAEIFHRTLAAVGAEPGQAVHVGDDPILDVQGARAAGMRAVHVTGPLRGKTAREPDAVIATLAGLPDAIAALDR